MPQHAVGLSSIAEQATNNTAFSTSSHSVSQSHTSETSSSSHHSSSNLAAAASDHAEKQSAKAPRFAEPDFGGDGTSSSASSSGDGLRSPSSRPEGSGLLGSPT